MRKKNIRGISILQFDNLSNDVCTHFTTTIHGGVSTGNYSSLNLGLTSGDDIESINENRRRLAEALGVSDDMFFVPNQTHGDSIVSIDEKFLSLSAEDKKRKLDGVDALITNQTNVCIAVGTADCVSLIILDPTKKVLAAVHAGWRGTVARIATKTVKRMQDEFGCNVSDILVGIGPSICAERFEVGEEVGEEFVKANFPMNDISYRNEKTGKLHIDLWEANKYQLIEVGIVSGNIDIARICTMTNDRDFFSARRQTIYSGRMLTGGVLK